MKTNVRSDVAKRIPLSTADPSCYSEPNSSLTSATSKWREASRATGSVDQPCSVDATRGVGEGSRQPCLPAARRVGRNLLQHRAHAAATLDLGADAARAREKRPHPRARG